ncbi:hypothetical protein P7C70_g8210, partial [Phenoliferia sp. Uapishka_3]
MSTFNPPSSSPPRGSLSTSDSNDERDSEPKLPTTPVTARGTISNRSSYRPVHTIASIPFQSGHVRFSHPPRTGGSTSPVFLISYPRPAVDASPDSPRKIRMHDLMEGEFSVLSAYFRRTPLPGHIPLPTQRLHPRLTSTTAWKQSEPSDPVCRQLDTYALRVEKAYELGDSTAIRRLGECFHARTKWLAIHLELQRERRERIAPDSASGGRWRARVSRQRAERRARELEQAEEEGSEGSDDGRNPTDEDAVVESTTMRRIV